jgi:hypothetical protein
MFENRRIAGVAWSKQHQQTWAQRSYTMTILERGSKHDQRENSNKGKGADRKGGSFGEDKRGVAMGRTCWMLSEFCSQMLELGAQLSILLCHVFFQHCEQ